MTSARGFCVAAVARGGNPEGVAHVRTAPDPAECCLPPPHTQPMSRGVACTHCVSVVGTQGRRKWKERDTVEEEDLLILRTYVYHAE